MARGRTGGPPAVRIEVENEWAWCGARRLELRPKTFAILRYLVDHPGRLVTKDELLGAVWGGTVVSEATLTSCIRDLRHALADASRAPRYIETVHRRGLRFIGPVQPVRPNAAGHQVPTKGGTDAMERDRPAPSGDPVPSLVGRESQLARLHAIFDAASAGRRQLVFVTGEPGIGKTTLVEAFLRRLEAGNGLRVG